MAETTEQDDRTEDPTHRRLEQAIERGDVAKSAEIKTLFVLGAFTLAVLVLAGPVARSLLGDLRGFLAGAHLVAAAAAGLAATARRALTSWFTAALLPVGLVALGGLAGG